MAGHVTEQPTAMLKCWLADWRSTLTEFGRLIHQAKEQHSDLSSVNITDILYHPDQIPNNSVIPTG